MHFTSNDGVRASSRGWARRERPDGVRLRYETAGPDDATAVAFVEGLGYGTWMWGWQRPALAESYRTVVWDNRGTGESDEPEGPYTTEEMAGDMAAVLDDAGVDRAHLVGASLGGMIALQYALDYDGAASLSLLCTSAGGDEAVPMPDDARARVFDVPRGLDRVESIRYRMRPAFTDDFWDANPEVIDRIVDRRLETDPSDRAYEWQAAAATSFDATDRLDEVDVPALVLHGTDDRVVPVENGRLLADGLPDARLETVAGGSHLFFVERNELVNERLLSFLDDV
ncbi:alpha/beta fold hydrolase [Halomicrobium urmianum]|uniref:alpha/beta fold hydrolase n=1 Tax=Halomicrobium urmianum TaxID=1586233 RepID=UPI001CD95E19|nr:alpha/beta hydrolase [Halomicrobium urmianum]